MNIAAAPSQDLLVRIRQGLDRNGYHYESCFGATDDGGVALVNLARQLGSIFVPEGFDPDHPVLVTQPAGDAPASQPFDRPEGIGWHNDFSTFSERPVLSLIWIAQQDPAGERYGAWRVASVNEVLTELRRDPIGQDVLSRLRSETFPLGYEASGKPDHFRLLKPSSSSCHRETFRFYGRSLREASRSIYGDVPPRVERIISAVERAADVVGTTLPATNYALLVVDNRHSLHDRTTQSTSEEAALRRAVLCFVESD